SRDAHNLSFIVVEDNAFQRTMAIKMLEAMGSSFVLGAENGHDAIKKLIDHDQPVDITITDLDMPGMDGVEFMRHLAEKKLCSAVAVASGMDMSLIRTVEELVEQHGLFVLGHIQKPMNQDKIKKLLDVYQSKQRIRNPDTFANEISLDDAINALNNQEFKVWYQPKVNLADGSWHAVEALARWEHPQQGIISPGRFIPLLEQAQRIHELTWQQLHILATDIQTWLKAGENIAVSVNLSPAMLNDKSLPEKLSEIVNHYKVPTKNIVLEITESIIMQNIALSLEIIARLKLRGFLLSIDDFGTGYSSFQQLGRIPFSELKIDQSFVKDAGENDKNRAIIESSINLAKQLNLKTVAEGVETAGEWKLLQSLGCDMGQGFFIAKAMPKKQLPEWYAQWQTKFNQLK
ncbi:MAG: EAL domain-containing response regulator, partial [Endozoicomonadaceae bacterium]|nr:EAL domain-containing response regulator [Endozoicomonadaceae bacterium]